MTTVVVVRKGDQAVIAADSLSTFGDTRIDAREDACWNKIFHSHGSYFSITGSAAHDLVLQTLLKKVKALDFNSRMAIFESFRKLHPKLKEDFFLKPEEDEGDPYESSQIIALMANSSGIYGVFSLREVYEYRRFWAVGSGRDFAIGAMHAVYDDPTLDAMAIAKIGIEAGCAFDVSSSLPMTHYVVTLDKESE